MLDLWAAVHGLPLYEGTRHLAETFQPLNRNSSDETVFNDFIADEADRRNEVRYEVLAYQGLYDGIDLHSHGRTWANRHRHWSS